MRIRARNRYMQSIRFSNKVFAGNLWGMLSMKTKRENKYAENEDVGWGGGGGFVMPSMGWEQ